ncbi:MAG TPA: hypothetical protein VFR96_11940 [Povalibacter sp.]|jgi:hypothetical protein|nr:hypothetical protein [Povalibacter sp.]
MGDHDRGERKHNFCAIPAKPKCGDCPGSKDYIEVCKPEDWFGHTFKRLVKAKSGAFTFDKQYEAHHLVCVAPVTGEVVSKKEIEGVIAQTKWCINNEKNMIAMPLWGHSVMWYCEITAAGGDFNEDKVAPPFKNIPQHDWDHNCKEGYTWEVTEACKKLAKKVEEAGHDIKGDDLKAALDQLAGKFRNILLNVRGTRVGGTHAAWAKGAKDPESDWCQPFSMASTVKLTRKGFPMRNFDTRTAQWIQRIANAIKATPA